MDRDIVTKAVVRCGLLFVSPLECRREDCSIAAVSTGTTKILGKR
ncbi:MAG: hypothetical protein ACI87E_002472 [Mariniblastus sp.]|jgi:hypothetical protein